MKSIITFRKRKDKSSNSPRKIVPRTNWSNWVEKSKSESRRSKGNSRRETMKALCWEGKNHVRLNRVPDPEIINPHDAIVKVTLSAICNADLHIYDGRIPAMSPGDILGHEFMGEVVE